MRLTKEQGAIVSAYTGYLCGDFSDMHAYAERILGRAIWTHEFANPSLTKELREAARSDFESIAAE